MGWALCKLHRMSQSCALNFFWKGEEDRTGSNTVPCPKCSWSWFTQAPLCSICSKLSGMTSVVVMIIITLKRLLSILFRSCKPQYFSREMKPFSFCLALAFAWVWYKTRLRTSERGQNSQNWFLVTVVRYSTKCIMEWEGYGSCTEITNSYYPADLCNVQTTTHSIMSK